jgi:ubiquinol-cytochrome c reductase cytochrome c1 subunit
VIILFFLPWLDHCEVKSIRFKPTWHSYLYAVFVINFIVLGYLGIKPPSLINERISQVGTLFYFGFFLLMPWWSRWVKPSHCLSASTLSHIEKRLEQTTMKKIILSLLISVFTSWSAFAATDTIPWDKAPNKINDLGALQNGAKLFVNYCLNCHAAAYMRFNRLTDIGLTEQQIKDNLLFTTDKVGETMKITMDPKQAKDWFGGNPPDLTVIARSRSGHGGTGADYIYTYLRSYYRDPSKATGWNNLAFPNVGMPHVLWELQGERKPLFDKVASHGHETQVFKGWQQVSAGKLSPAEYDAAVGDLVSYMQWMSDPTQSLRVQVGVWVMIFLLIFMFIAWRLNAAFWKDIR